VLAQRPSGLRQILGVANQLGSISKTWLYGRYKERLQEVKEGLAPLATK
jgi:hypothetical protein